MSSCAISSVCCVFLRSFAARLRVTLTATKQGTVSGAYLEYGTFAGMWYLAPGSKSSLVREIGEDIP